MRLFTWDDDGKRIHTDVPFEPYLFIETKSNPDATSIFNTGLAKKAFKNTWERNQFLKDKCHLKRIFHNLPAEQQFLIDMFKHDNSEEFFNQHPLKIFYLDIETYSPGDFPNPRVAPDPINIITIYDSISKMFYSWGLGGKNGDNFKAPENVIYTHCDTESELLLKFLKFWKTDYPDIVTGWFSDSFDIPYLINRLKYVLGDDAADQLSPVRNLYKRENVETKYGKVYDQWYIKGIAHLDYVDVYKTFTKDKRERYNLNFIGETELNETKVEVPGSDLPALADNDWQTFCEYNIQDVNLIVKLEESLHYLSIVRRLAYMGYTTFEQALGTIHIVSGAIALKALEEDKYIPTFKHEHAQSEFDGGFVRIPKIGLKSAMLSFDANSLYPNTIISANISPETKLGKIISKSDTQVEIKLTNNDIFTLTHEEFFKFIEQEKLSITKAKVLYSQKKKGFCPKLLDGIYSERVTIQDKLKKHKRAIKICKKGSDKYKENEKRIIELNTMQYTLKILMNRLYGAFGNKYSALFDIDAAASVTLTGQQCIKEAANITAEFVKSKYDIDEDCTIYGDTDSVYITIAPILEKLGKTLINDSGKITKDAYTIAEELEEHLNKNINIWAKRTCNILDPRFVFKRETICNSGLFMAKKRYILHVLDDEGLAPDPEKEIKYTGVEVVSIQIPKKVKPLIKSVCETLIKTRDYKKTNEAFRNAYEEYLKLDIEDISKPVGVKTFDKYYDASNGFNVKKGTPGHVKSALVYNHLLKVLGLTRKYEQIKQGDDIKTFYTEPNKYDVKGVAFLTRYPKEFDIKIDKNFMFNKSVTPIITRLYNTVGWKLKNPTAEQACDLLELLG